MLTSKCGACIFASTCSAAFPCHVEGRLAGVAKAVICVHGGQGSFSAHQSARRQLRSFGGAVKASTGKSGNAFGWEGVLVKQEINVRSID